jgi:hypothetical protein
MIAAVACSSPPARSAGPAKTPSPVPTPSPTPAAVASPSPSPQSSGRAGTIELSNLTFGHAEATPLVTTERFDPPADTLVLAHVMAFRHGGPEPPALTGNGLTWSLVGGNLDGEKRHWVFRGVGSRPSPGSLTIDWQGFATETLWVIDVAVGTAVGNEGADAIVQFVSQESQQNATGGVIELASFADPVNNVAVCFALAGSGAASDISPTDGFTETAEANNPGQNLIIDNFWKRGEDTTCDAEFLRDTGAKEIQSWLFLAVELRAANT